MFKNFFVVLIFFLLFCAQSVFASTKLLPPSGDNIYFGAFPDFGGPEDNVTAQRIIDFENVAQKNIMWAAFSQNWLNGITYPIDSVHTIRNQGKIPLIRMMPRSDFEEDHQETVYSLQKIIDGAFDVQLHKWARDAKNDASGPILIDFAVEPDGDWFGWSGIYNGAGTTGNYGDPTYPDGPERWRDAYRHIIDIFRNENVTNVTWFFHVDINVMPEVEWNSPKYYYPGDDYIDWIGISIYGAQQTHEPWWGLFSEMIVDNHMYITEITNAKPIAVLEFGVTDHHDTGNKSEWLRDAFSTVKSNPYINFKAISYWHENWENDNGNGDAFIRIDSSPETLRTFQSLISDSRFITCPTFSHPIITAHDTVPLYRFWSKKNQGHFYTASEAEKDLVINKYDDNVWHYEGVANTVFAQHASCTVPVYRFWSKKNQGHFYTASEAEKNLVISKYDDYVWKYEGIAYYAYPTQQPNSTPVYRFWSKKNQHHFYTASEAEKDLVINKYDDYVWHYEGVAWYVAQ